jgi:hypothetical protein
MLFSRGEIYSGFIWKNTSIGINEVTSSYRQENTQWHSDIYLNGHLPRFYDLDHPLSQSKSQFQSQSIYNPSNTQFNLQLPTKMKFTTTTIAALVAVLPMANAWIFSTCSGQWDSHGNQGCTKSSCKTGDTIDWENTWGSECTLRVYSDKSCDNQIGIADDDWNDHTLSKSMGSFRVSGC